MVPTGPTAGACFGPFTRSLAASAMLGGILVSGAFGQDRADADLLAAAKTAAKAAGAGMPPPAAPQTTDLLMFLQPGVDANAFAAANRLRLLRGLRSDPNAFVFSAETPAVAAALAGRPLAGVRWMELDIPTRHVPLFAPNDPYFPRNGGGAGQPGQWHVVNQHTAGLDVKVQGAWNLDITGAGVIIGVVDDGLETAHPDLAPNYVAADSFNFDDNIPDPNPVGSNDRHGISVAGVAGARGGNSIGVTGAAPFAGLAGLRIDYSTSTTSDFVDATLYHSSGAITNIDIKNHSYGIPAPYITTTSEVNAMTTSAAAGTIHVLSAGNERGASGQDSNKKDLQNSFSGITVAALGNDGLFATYSSFGANIFVTATSSTDKAGGFGVTTTDRTSGGYNGFPDLNYTDEFGGTSSSAPLVAGVLALAREVQPNLDVRMAKHLLARTSSLVDPTDSTGSSDGGWKTNGAGFQFNQNYGFGLVNATELVAEAPLFQGVTPLETFSSGTITVNSAIPDGNATGLTRSFDVTADAPLEEVLATLNITHPFRGDIEAFLVSPMGTSSRLALRSGGDSGDNINWQFISNAFWGEDPSGLWSLRVIDTFSDDLGVWNSWSLDLRMGSLVAIPEPAAVTLLIGGLGLALRRRRACLAGAGR